MTKPFTRPRHCSICYRSIPHASTGRPRLTCGDRCRQIKRRRSLRSPFQTKRAQAARHIARWEKRLGLDFSTLPAYRQESDVMSLRDRLMIYLPREMPVHECSVCDRPYMPDGQTTPTCSEKCTRLRRDYLHKIKDALFNLHPAKRRLTMAVYDYHHAGKRLNFCAHCDDPFIPTRSDRKYCTHQCRRLAWWHRRKYGIIRKSFGWQPKPKKCVECGKTYTPTRARWQNYQRYCSDSCSRHHFIRLDSERRAAAIVSKPCAYCGEVFTPTAGRRGQEQHYCKPTCRRQMRYALDRDQRAAARPPIPCTYCGESFTPIRRGQRNCSSVCSNQQNNTHRREHRRLARSQPALS